VPLYTDAAVFASLTAGEYFLVVSAAENSLDPLLAQDFGPGAYDPVRRLMPMGGSTTGSYVLNVLLIPNDGAAPEVVALNVQPNGVLTEPLTGFMVHFSEPVNLQQLAYRNDQLGTTAQAQPVYLRGPEGERVYPRLVQVDETGKHAQFVLLDRLTNGVWELHLSGALGLTDLSGNALVGNPDASGDYIVPFTVAAASALAAGRHVVTNPVDTYAAPQDLGVLFGREIEQGIVISRDLPEASHDDADYFRFSVLQTAEYVFTLGGVDRTVPGRPVLLDEQGNELTLNPHPVEPGNPSLRVFLTPGVHVIKVDWDAAALTRPVYDLTISVGASQENPTPLTQGPAPAFRLHLRTNAPTAGADPAPLRLTPPAVAPVIPASLLREAGGTTVPSRIPAAPAGTVAGLASGPVGVVSGPAADAALAVRLSLPALESIAGDSLLPVAQQVYEGSTAPPAPTGDTSAIWKMLVDRLFEMLQQMTTPLLDTPDEEKSDDEGEPASALAIQQSATVLPSAPSDVAGGVLMSLGGLALLCERRERKRTRKGCPVPKLVVGA
jgi:hypothetical protein